MHQDPPDESREATPTDAAPPPSEPQGERPTQPPDPIAEAGALKAVSTMMPAAPTVPSAPSPAPPEYWKSAYDKLCEIHEEQKHDRAARQERDDTLVVRVSDAIATRLEPRFVSIESNDAAQDDKIKTVTAAVAALQEKFRDVEAAMNHLMQVVNSSSDDKTALSGRKVLLVDNEPLILKSLTKVLAAHGATVITAETLNVVKALIGTGIKPDSALIDVRLSNGDDGGELAAWLVGTGGMLASQVLLMSGATGAPLSPVAEVLGLRLLDKPMPNGELVRVIREASNRPS